MRSNTKYLLPEPFSKMILPKLSEYVFKNIPAKDIQSTILLEEYCYLEGNPTVCLQQIYRSDQVKQGKLTGKPFRINLTKIVNDTLENTELGFTTPTELRKILKTLGYVELGRLTSLRTTFALKDSLIAIPVTISEVKELGNFIEVGEIVGPISNIERLIKILSVYGLQESWECSQSYLDLILEKNQR